MDHNYKQEDAHRDLDLWPRGSMVLLCILGGLAFWIWALIPAIHGLIAKVF